MSTATGRKFSRNGEEEEDTVRNALQWPPSLEDAARILDLSGQNATGHEPAGSINAPAGSINPGQAATNLGQAATTAERERPPLKTRAAREVRPTLLRSTGGVGGQIWPSLRRARDAFTRWATTRYVGLGMLGVVVLGSALFLLRGVPWRPDTALPRAAASARPESDGMAAKGGLGTAAKSSPVARGAANTFSTTDYAASPGRLSVETQPAGAAVVVDGTRRGLSPISVTGLTAGDHEVLIRTRHGELRQRVRLAAGESVSVVVPLAAVPTSAPPPVASRPTDASLVVRAPIELRIFEGDQLLGTSAMERTPLTPGAHRLVLRNDEVGFELARTVTVTAGKTLPLSIDVPRQQVAVNAAPWADVWADGRHVGQTPIGNLPLSPGPHALVFRHPQLGEKSLRLLVRANEPGRVSVDMRK